MQDENERPDGSLDGPGRPVAHEPAARPDDLVSLVMSCVTALDEMARASTSARLALVADRLAAVVKAPTWCVSLAHHDRLFEVSAGGTPEPATGGPPDDESAAVPDIETSARLRASYGGGYYADERTGDETVRRGLVDRKRCAVIGAGGYDQDGRSWLVEVFADPATPPLAPATPVLTALVQAALCFPREAFVPRPLEPIVRTIIRQSPQLAVDGAAMGLDATG